MTGFWDRLVADGMLRDLTAVAVAHVCAIPHVLIWYIRKRRRSHNLSLGRTTYLSPGVMTVSSRTDPGIRPPSHNLSLTRSDDSITHSCL